jgi:hypothetical protein
MPPHSVTNDNVLNPIALAPEFHNPAVARCCKAWNRVFTANQKAGTDPVLVYVRANEAFRFAMPPLSTPRDLCDFVACVAHGLVLNTLALPHAAALINAARVASHAFRLAANPARMSVAHARKRKNKISGCEMLDWDFAALGTATYYDEFLGIYPEFDRKSR